MAKTIGFTKEKLVMGFALLGLALGNMALNGICFFGIYEPAKPKILENDSKR